MSLCTDSVSGGSDRSGRRLDRRSGQIIVLATLSLSVLFALVGLSVDLGYSYYIKSAAQAAADSAASAAAVYALKNGLICTTNIVCGTSYNCASPPTSPPATAFQAGCLYAQANGFTNTGNQSVSLIANNTAPPLETGVFPALWIQANVSETVPHLFLFWSGFHSGSVAAQTVAGVTSSPPPGAAGAGCVYVLDNGNTSDALNTSGSMTLSGCGIYVNSSNSTYAAGISGSAKITAAAFDIHGGYTLSGTATTSPVPATGTAVVADPLASLVAPTVSTTCSQTSYNKSSGSWTLDPGVYCGGITVSGTTTSLTFSPGVYILNGGGFNVSGTSVSLTGSNVMFFLTGQHGYSNAPLNWSGGATISFTAPNTGTYEGVLIYQDPSSTYASTNQISGSVPFSGSGTFFFPTTKLTLSGSMSANYIAIICWDLNISGSAKLENDTTGTYTGLYKANASLME